MNRAQGVSETPWQNYGGEFVAPINPQQYTGIGNVNQYAFAAQPTLGVAQNMAWNAAQPISYADIARYQNPWTQNVVGATEAQFNNQNMQQLQNVRGNAIAQGALGGDREAVAEAELANQQNLAQAPVIANLMSQGYTQGVNTALTEQQALASGAYSLGNLGVAGQTAGLTGAGAQIQAGGLEQTTQQAADTAAYNQWLASRAYPFQTTQWLAGLDTGVGSQMGGTSTTQAPTPSPWSQMAGLGLGGLGIMGATGGFGPGGWFAPAVRNMFSAHGGRINGVAGYEDGGGVSPLPYASGRPWEPYAGGRGWVPTAAMTHGQGAPRPPQPPQQDSDPMKLGEQVAGLAKYFKDGKTPTGFPSGGTSSGWFTSDSPITTGYSGVPAGGGVAPSGPASWAASGSPIMSGYSGVAPVAVPPLPPGTGWAGAGSPLMTGYWHGGSVRGYADGGMPSDIDLPYDVHDPGIAPRALMRAVAPGLYDYVTAERPPPDIVPNVVGKVPSATHDPYAEGAVRDVAGLGMAAVPLGRAAGLAARAGEMGGERLGLGAIGDVSGSLPTAGLGARTGTAAGIAALLPGGPAEAADAALGPRPGVTLEEQAQVDRLNKEISGLTAQRANATKGMGPKGASVQAQAFDSQIAQRNTSIRTIMDQVAARQQAYDERAEEFAKKTGPFATREPGWNAALTAAPAASAASGAILGGLAGRKISPMKRVATYGAAGLGGGLEGLIGGYYPTYADLHMPEGSVAKAQAEARESDPRFWEHGVAPEIGMSAATGLLGAKYGMLRREAKPVAAAAEAAISPSRYPDLKDVAAVRRYQAGLKQDTAGRWYEPGKGMVSKEYWPPAKPSGKVVPIQAAEAHGGVVRGYADGGSPEDDFGNFGSVAYAPVAWANTSPSTGVAPSDPNAAAWDAYPKNMTPQRHMPGEPYYRSDIVSSVQDEWRNAGMTNPNGVAGVTWNIGKESNFDPTLRHPDQPRWGGEAHYAHGLYQEGGQEFLNYQKYLRDHGLDPSGNWNDPHLQSQFAAWNLKTNYPDTWARMQNARSPQEAAAVYAREYLRPSSANLNSRLRELGHTQGNLMPSGDAQITPAAYSSHGVAGGGDLVPLSPASGSQPTGVAPSGIDLSSNSKLWPSLMAAGFGMMASRSPYPLQAIGEGALTGMGAYTKASELESARAMKQSEIDLQAQKLWQQNETERRKLALRAQTPVVTGEDEFGRKTYGLPGQFVPSPQTPLPQSKTLPSTDGMRMISNLTVDDKKIAELPPELRGPDPNRNEEFLKGLDPQMAATVRGLADYAINPNSLSTRGGHREKLLGLTREYDGDYDQRLYNASQRGLTDFFAGGPQSPAGTMTAGNTAIMHAKEMSDAIEQMRAQPGILNEIGRANIPFGSYAANALNNRAVKGTNAGAALTAFQTARQRFTEEVTKFYSGSAGSEAERDRAIKLLDEAKSLPELREAIAEDAQLMKDKVEQMEGRLRTSMGPIAWRRAMIQDPDGVLVYKNSRAALDEIMRRQREQTSGQSGGQPQASPTTQAPKSAFVNQETIDEFRRRAKAAGALDADIEAKVKQMQGGP